MAAIEWSDVLEHAAELSTVTAGARETILGVVNAYLEVSIFGGEDSDKLKLARIYLAAHIATSAARAGAAGPMTSSSAGRLSRSYAVAQSASGTFGATSYGVLLRMLIDTTSARLGTVA